MQLCAGLVFLNNHPSADYREVKVLNNYLENDHTGYKLKRQSFH